MKKILPILAVVLVAAIGIGAFAYMRNPSRAACVKVADLCGEKDGTKEKLDQCVDQIDQWRKVAGNEPVDKGLQCVDQSKTCGEAMGCVAGAGVNGFKNVVDDFLKGFGKGIGK